MKTQIAALVKKYHKLAERVYDRKFTPIAVINTQRRSTIAGKAYMGSRPRVWINVAVHQVKPEMLEDTVAHEVAHIISYALHGSDGGDHGHHWQRTMKALGQTPDRTYSGTDEQLLAGKNMTRHIYRCECGYELNMSAKRHNNILRGSVVFHKGCRGKTLTYVRQTDKHTIIHEKIAARDSNTTPTQVKRTVSNTPKSTSKLDTCRKIYDWTESRQQNINRFVTEAGCTTAGAATYYAKIKKE